MEAWNYNRLLYQFLSRKGLWRYHKIDDLGRRKERAWQYLLELEHVLQTSAGLAGGSRLRNRHHRR